MSMMPVTCPGCGGRYNVPVTMAGKQAKCQKCGGAIPIPAAAAMSASAAQDAWYVMVNGQQVGPVTKTELDHYASQGQLPPQALVRRADQSQWQPITSLYPHLAAPPSNEAVGYLAQLQSAQQQASQQVRPAPQAPSPYEAYASPESTGYRPRRASGGLPGVLVAMCVTVFVLSGLGIVVQMFIFIEASSAPVTIQRLPQAGGVDTNSAAYRAGQIIGFVLDLLLSVGKIAGGILLLSRKAVGRTLLKVCTIISLVFVVARVAFLLPSLTVLGSALPAVVIVIDLLVLGGSGAYYWFILSTLARDDVINALE